ncbi:MAG: Gfo/Idh/MocA family oxidoreductase [Planctomycetaceae bacterium]|nr:Gfo/Idh/MocA family oxidoreductase [Planctomycetaceae bacterium]
MEPSPTRRDFMLAAASVAAFSSLPTAAAAVPRAARARLANGRLQFGVVGWGIRAREIYNMFLDDPDVEIVSVCDVVDARAKEGVRRVNERRKAEVCRQVADWRAVVHDAALDGVIVTTPDHWHAEPAIAASLSGKHVYCEKPLSLSIAEGRAIASAARAGGIRFQTGSQQRSEYGHMFVRAAEAVRNGRIGTLKRITIGVGEPPKRCDLPEEPLPEGIDWDGWLGQAPMRPFSSVLCPIGVHDRYPAWRHYREYCNGGLADMGAHHFDIAQWAMDMDASGPREVIPPADGAKTGLRFVYANGVEMIHGGPTDCTFFGSEGTIEVSRGHLRAYKGEDRTAPDAAELLAEPTGNELRLPRNRSHIDDFLCAIREGRDPICTAETGHRTATVCQLCVIGYEIGKPLTWDATAERFTGEHAAAGNALLATAVRRHR